MKLISLSNCYFRYYILMFCSLCVSRSLSPWNILSANTDFDLDWRMYLNLECEWMIDSKLTDSKINLAHRLCIYYTRSRRILVWCFFRCCLVNKWSNFSIYFSLNSTKKLKHWLLLSLPLIFHRFVDTLIECDSSEMAIVHHTITYTCT